MSSKKKTPDEIIVDELKKMKQLFDKFGEEMKLLKIDLQKQNEKSKLEQAKVDDDEEGNNGVVLNNVDEFLQDLFK